MTVCRVGVPRDDRAHQAEEQVMIKRLRSYVIEKIALQVYDSEAVMERLREWQEWDDLLEREGVPREKDMDLNTRAFEALKS